MHLLEPITGFSSPWIEPLESRLMLSSGPIPDFPDLPCVRDAGGGRVLMAGWVAQSVSVVARVGPDGNLDPTFGGGDGIFSIGGVAWIDDVLIQQDGKILLVALPADDSLAILYRLNDDGTLDEAFADHGRAWLRGRRLFSGTIALEDDGDILVAAPDAAAAGRWRDLHVWRFGSDGLPDTAFGAGGKTTLHSARSLDYVASIRQQPSGEIDIAAPPFNDGGLFARLRPDGSPDESFAKGGVKHLPLHVHNEFLDDLAYEWSVLPDGRLLTVHEDVDDQDLIVVERYTADGLPDPTFGNDGVARLRLSNWSWIAGPADLLPDGRAIIEVATTGYTTGPVEGMKLIVIRPDGALDAAFADQGELVLEDRPNVIAVGGVPWADDDGGIIAIHPAAPFEAGAFRVNELIIDWFDASGAPRTGFAAGGHAVLEVGLHLIPPIDYVEHGPPRAPPGVESPDDPQETPTPADNQDNAPPAAASPTPFSSLLPTTTDDADDGLLLLGVLPARTLLGQSDDDLFAA